jgi:hypothetical protein
MLHYSENPSINFRLTDGGDRHTGRFSSRLGKRQGFPAPVFSRKLAILEVYGSILSSSPLKILVAGFAPIPET